MKSFLSEEQNIFEGMNIRYFGPYDGHNVLELVEVLQGIKEMKGPKLLHIKTVKGKGYGCAEADPLGWHAPGKFDPEAEVKIATPERPDAAPKFQDVFGHTLVDWQNKIRASSGSRQPCSPAAPCTSCSNKCLNAPSMWASLKDTLQLSRLEWQRKA